MKYKFYLLSILIFLTFEQIQCKNNIIDNEFAEFEVPDESVSETDDNSIHSTIIKEDKENPEFQSQVNFPLMWIGKLIDYWRIKNVLAKTRRI